MTTTTKERPILFSGPMVRAILEGRKTMTRRVITRPERFSLIRDCARLCPFGVPGDRLWVRETWQGYVRYGERSELLEFWAPRCDDDQADFVEYAATPTLAIVERWRSPIFMPRWASRLTLEVTGVRVERLQEISEQDAQAEGVTPFPKMDDGDCWTNGKYRTAFEYGWNEMHGWAPNSFESNPWVWVVSFRRC